MKNKNKNKNKNPPSNQALIVYILFVIIYLEEDTQKYIYIYDIGFTEFKGGMRKINNSFKIPRNTPNIRISHSLKFSIKPNIRIFIFSGI